MDKYEYKVRAEEIKELIAEGEFAEAVKIADTIDWRRVKSVMMLCTISDLYKINRRFQESKDILLMAYERHPGGRLIVYSLCELSIKMGEFVQAIEYYKEFVQIAPKDTGRYILQYKLYEAQDVSLEERIAVLEEFKKRDYREKWAYELAYLYHRVGLETKCVEECDEMILWFGEGRYVMKALELKMLHQPLSATQQEKYLLMKQKIEQPEEEEVEEQPETNTQESYVEGMQAAEQPEPMYHVSGYPQAAESEEGEEDFRVKTVDLGQYNTINLQQALAESMKEILGDEEQNESEAESESEPSTMGAITESIIAPLLQETDDIPQVSEKESVPLQQPGTEMRPGSPIATEEVFFEEDVKDVLLEDTKEINVGDTKEIQPKKRVIYPSVTPVRPVVTKQSAAAVSSAASTQAQEIAMEASQMVMSETVVQPEQSIPAQGPSLMKPAVKPSGFEQMLSQEYDGQISLVVPNKTDVEKQITGQMNINDIMAEWERMKRENEEKRREDVRKRVQQHTGNLFSEFDEATKTGLLEQLEKAVVEAILKESGETMIKPKKLTTEQLTDIVRNVGRNSTEQQGVVKGQTVVPEIEEEVQKAEVIEEAPITEEVNAEETATVEAAPPESVFTDPEDVESESKAAISLTEEIKEATAAAEALVAEQTLTEAILSQEMSEEAVEERTVKKEENVAEAAITEGKSRMLTEEEKELFGKFIHNRKTKEQIVHAIDNISMDSYSGNVIITGEEEAGTLELAKNLVRILQMTDHNFSGKVAKISGETLNKKDVQATLAKLTDGALIIEYATDMSSGTATDLNKVLAKEGKGIFVIMEGKRDEMNLFLRKNYALMDNFNARIDIESLNDQALVEYAKQYAEEMEYSIDELGILALHTRIADMQTSDHEVTVAEVRDLVDDAIYFADKKNPKHFFDILFGKRYDEEDMIILREKDFMHY